MKFEGRRAVITGGASGIGLAIARRLSAQAGAIDRQTQPDDGRNACDTRSLLGRLFDQIVA
jgi:NAD(P)-dependent dehydrogenase (short-subunit alcohol dehydrogenase family)